MDSESTIASGGQVACDPSDRESCHDATQRGFDSPSADSSRDADAGASVVQVQPEYSGTSRWWLAVLACSVLTLPFAWLLSHAALLPFFLGLFFFVLFGLLIGAAMHRIAAPTRPYTWSTLAPGTVIIVLIGWAGSITIEGLDLPRKIAAEASDRSRYIGSESIDDFRSGVQDEVRSFFRQSYPPGGALGYVQWVVTSGELTKNDVPRLRLKLQRHSRGTLWIVRVLLSLIAFSFGVGSQAYALHFSKDSLVRLMDAETDD